jgi:uncharacterized small protein (DUF1192 family)
MGVMYDELAGIVGTLAALAGLTFSISAARRSSKESRQRLSRKIDQDKTVVWDSGSGVVVASGDNTICIGGFDEPTSLPARIEALRENLSRSGALIEEINAEIAVQNAELDRIKAQAEQDKQLAEVQKAQADAVRHLIDVTTRKAQEAVQIENNEIRKTILDEMQKDGKKQQRLYFLSGTLLAVPLGVLGNYVYSLF